MLRPSPRDDRAAESTTVTSEVRLMLAGARMPVNQPSGLERLPGVVNYLLGRDPDLWRTGIPQYARVAYDDVYPGIDLVHYGGVGLHEYDFVVAPGANPARIMVAIEGATSVDQDPAGHIEIRTPTGTLTMRAPHASQWLEGGRQAVTARFVLQQPIASEPPTIGFELGEYDRDALLVIDPQLVYATYLGGRGDFDQLWAVDVDDAGAAYVVGQTDSVDYPTERSIQSPRSGDAVISKLTPDGRLAYSTYLGGDGFDAALDVGVRADGTAYVLGQTDSRDFPIRDAYQREHRGNGDAFVVQLNREGTAITRGTYLGGSGIERPHGLQLSHAFDGDPPVNSPPNVFGDWVFVYGSTESLDFPTRHALQARRRGDQDGFVTVFDRATLQPGYSTYVGREGRNQAERLALNPARGDVYLWLQHQDDGPLLAHLKPRAQQAASPAIAPIRHVAPQREFPFDNLGSQIDFALWTRLGLFNEEIERQIGLAKLARMNACSMAPLLQQARIVEQAAWVASCRSLIGAGPQMDVAPPLERGVLSVVRPGCLPVPPATRCSDRAVMVFYDEDLRVITHVNFGGRASGQQFAPTRSVTAADGQLHIVGSTNDRSLPLINPVQGSHQGGLEGFILTLSPASGETSFLSYLGGTANDIITDIAVDKDGHTWIVGSTQSTDFPATRSGVQTELRGRMDGFVVKITR